MSTISEVIMGRRKPPLRRIATWATVLALNEDECRTWKLAAAIAHARPEVRNLIDELQTRIEALTTVPAHMPDHQGVTETKAPLN